MRSKMMSLSSANPFEGDSIYFLINISFCLGIIVLIAVIDNGRPKLFVERDLWNYITVPMFFAILAILYSCFIILFNFGIVVIQ